MKLTDLNSKPKPRSNRWKLSWNEGPRPFRDIFDISSVGQALRLPQRHIIQNVLNIQDEPIDPETMNELNEINRKHLGTDADPINVKIGRALTDIQSSRPPMERIMELKDIVIEKEEDVSERENAIANLLGFDEELKEKRETITKTDKSNYIGRRMSEQWFDKNVMPLMIENSNLYLQDRFVEDGNEILITNALTGMIMPARFAKVIVSHNEDKIDRVLAEGKAYKDKSGHTGPIPVHDLLAYNDEKYSVTVSYGRKFNSRELNSLRLNLRKSFSTTESVYDTVYSHAFFVSTLRQLGMFEQALGLQKLGVVKHKNIIKKKY